MQHNDNVETESVEILDEELENMKERAVMAESRVDALELEKVHFLAQIQDLSAKLDSSLEHQRKYMVAGDNAVSAKEAVNDDTAAKVTKSLESKLSLMPIMDKNLGGIFAKVAELPGLVAKQVEEVLTKQSLILHGKIQGLTSSVDNSRYSLSEGINTTNDTLACFGMAEGEDHLDIPSCLKTVVENMAGGGQGDFPQVVPGVCYFLSSGMVATYVCKCKCGSEIQYDSIASVGNSNPVGGHGAFVTGQNAHHDVGSVGGDGALMTQQPQVLPYPHSTAPGYASSQYVAPQYGSQFPSPVIAPNLVNPPSSSSMFSAPPPHIPRKDQGVAGAALSRKERKIVKNQEYKEDMSKKPRYDSSAKQKWSASKSPLKAGKSQLTVGKSPMSGGKSPYVGPRMKKQPAPNPFLWNSGPRVQTPNTLPNWGSGIISNPSPWLGNPRFGKPT